MAPRVRVTFEEIHVGARHDDVRTWRVFFSARVDGTPRGTIVWWLCGVSVEQGGPVGRHLDLDLDGDLAIHVGGFQDDESVDDRLPTIDSAHAPDARWEHGGTRYERSASAAGRHYAVRYTIGPVPDPAPPDRRAAPRSSCYSATTMAMATGPS